VTKDVPHILLINPWIHDFAAYDFWAKPLGLLILAAILQYHGFRVSYVDCLDRFHPRMPPADPNRRQGRGPYLKTPLPKPRGLEEIPRNYSRYGILPEWFLADLAALAPPDLILVTSLMTYWYPGVKETIGTVRGVFPKTPILLGGIYASLCRGHALKTAGADQVVSGAGEPVLLDLVSRMTGFAVAPKFDLDDPDAVPYPAFHLQRRLAYVPLLTSRGCPFHCSYCASDFLNPHPRRRNPQAVVEEIRHWHRTHGVVDFAFYDDALLIDAPGHAIPLLEGIIASGLKLRLHTPNALHIREISEATACLLFRAGFDTLRLGLETTAFDQRDGLDSKVSLAEFTAAVRHLKNAGFKKEQVGAYLLAGLPGQSVADLEESIRVVRQSGVTPILAHYSPIPHTAMWPAAAAASRLDLAADPVFCNNALCPCQNEAFSWQTLSRLKNLAAGR
jgi:radical SAM superfamily enzyme YgiQ (UPF0313 family)